MRWLDCITDSVDVNLSKLGDGEGQGSLVCGSHGIAKNWNKQAGETWKNYTNVNLEGLK